MEARDEVADAPKRRGRPPGGGSKAEPAAKPAAPDHLTMCLFAPGMTALHRAGLGGLACTLAALERQHKAGLLRDDRLPGPVAGGKYPWDIDGRSVTLRFGEPGKAAEYLKRLFAFAFQIRDGVIYLPGQYPDPPPSLAVRAELQAGLTLTFLQHGQTRKLGAVTPYYVDPDGSGVGVVPIDYRPCAWFKHQDGWADLTDAKTGLLAGKRVEVIGPLNPGAVVRHVAFGAASRIDERPEGALPLYFALVGCLGLSITRGAGVLVVPEVGELKSFREDRPHLTPRTAAECRVAGTGDAVLQALVRLRARAVNEEAGLSGCHAARFAPTAWASQQKSRVNALTHDASEAHVVEPAVASSEDVALARFEVAMAELPPRVRRRKATATVGVGKSKAKVERDEYFWAESTIRPLIAANLVLGRKWYDRFVTLADSRSKRAKLSYERLGLKSMIDNEVFWTTENEQVVVHAVHGAMYNLRGKIAQIYRDKDQPQLIPQKFEDEREKWGRTFSGNTTCELFRKSIADMFRRGGPNPALQKDWTKLLPMLRRKTWQHARDLALIALCSYSSPAGNKFIDVANELPPNSEQQES